MLSLLITHNIAIGFDPHQDTPVEILHVILLGFVKYYWRDAMVQLSDEQKTILTHRLSSLDVSALGVSPLVEDTLVKYAHSLTGSNFHIIAQVALFVLYNLLPKQAYDAWLALSVLIPLVWQPAIEDIESYLVCVAFLSLLFFTYTVTPI